MKRTISFLLFLSVLALIFVGCGADDFEDVYVHSPYKVAFVSETDTIGDGAEVITPDRALRDAHLHERLSDKFGLSVEFDILWEKQVTYNGKSGVLYHVSVIDENGDGAGEAELCIYQK